MKYWLYYTAQLIQLKTITTVWCNMSIYDLNFDKLMQIYIKYQDDFDFLHVNKFDYNTHQYCIIWVDIWNQTSLICIFYDFRFGLKNWVTEMHLLLMINLMVFWYFQYFAYIWILKIVRRVFTILIIKFWISFFFT